MPLGFHRLRHNSGFLLLFAAVMGFALGGSVVAALEEPVVHNQRQPAQTNSANEQAGDPTANPSGPKHPEERDQKGRWYDIFAEHPTDWLLVLFNFILAAFTVRLFYATGGLVKIGQEQARDMKASIAVSKEAAEAALMQARAAVSSMRAHMTPGFPTPVSGAKWNVEIGVINTGRAVGTVGNTHVCFADELTAIPDYSKARIKEDSTVRGPGERKVIGTFAAPHVKEGSFCYGFIRFTDEIGRWRRGFCVQIFSVPPEGKNFFHEAGGTAYNSEDQET